MPTPNSDANPKKQSADPGEPEWMAVREALVGEDEAPAPRRTVPTPDRVKAVKRFQSRRILLGLAMSGAFILFLLVLAAAGYWIWLQLPPPPPGTVTGQVVSLSGEPIAGAEVTIETDDETDGASVQSITDAQGRFTLTGAPSGEPWVVIRLPDGGGVSLPVQVKSHQTTDIGTVPVFRP